MTNKENFIKVVEELLNEKELTEEISKAIEYLNGLKNSKDITEKGQMILEYMTDNRNDMKNLFSSKMIGDGLGIGAKSVSGAMRSLVSNGLVTKTGQNPVMYSLV